MKKKIVTAGVLIGLCGIPGVAYYAFSDQPVYEYIAYADISEVTANAQRTYVVLSSDTCVTCKKLESDLKELSEENSQIAELQLYCVKLDESNCKEIFREYEIEGAPAILKFTNGVYDEMLYQQITKEEILSFIS